MNLPTMGSSTSRPTTWLGRAFAATYVLIIVVACAYLVINGPQIHAALDADRARVIGQEDAAFCSKFGAGRETDRFLDCADGLREIRARHDQRTADTLF